jgi:hypothetical protein
MSIAVEQRLKLSAIQTRNDILWVFTHKDKSRPRIDPSGGNA